jgi:hypothetical protein
MIRGLGSGIAPSSTKEGAMVCGGGLSRDYVATISGGMGKVHFLESIPWVIDAGVQALAPLLRALKFDATRLAELPDRWTGGPSRRFSEPSQRSAQARSWSLVPGLDRRPPTAPSGRHSCSVANGRGEPESTRLPTSICREEFRGRGEVRRGFRNGKFPPSFRRGLGPRSRFRC